jgi:putative two-component system response regulator
MEKHKKIIMADDSLMKDNHAYRDIPVIFISAMRNEQSETQGLELGAVDYIHKPYSSSLLLRRIETHLSHIERKRELQILNAAKQEKLTMEIEEVFNLQNTMLNVVASMVASLDDATGGHIYRIQWYLKCLIDASMDTDTYGDEIRSWDMDFVLPSSQLHDLGKIAISDAILNKAGNLTDSEFEIMKMHTQIGVQVICRMEKARQLLLSSDTKVAQVAQSVGFENSAYFNVVFKKHYGIAPGEYRYAISE